MGPSILAVLSRVFGSGFNQLCVNKMIIPAPHLKKYHTNFIKFTLAIISYWTLA